MIVLSIKAHRQRNPVPEREHPDPRRRVDLPTRVLEVMRRDRRRLGAEAVFQS